MDNDKKLYTLKKARHIDNVAFAVFLTTDRLRWYHRAVHILYYT